LTSGGPRLAVPDRAHDDGTIDVAVLEGDEHLVADVRQEIAAPGIGQAAARHERHDARPAAEVTIGELGKGNLNPTKWIIDVVGDLRHHDAFDPALPVRRLRVVELVAQALQKIGRVALGDFERGPIAAVVDRVRDRSVRTLPRTY
jgi:hypothetical protein